ncbi:uncharacterized protein LOC119109921 [Pollicipes pollicipes]|uniref:uncharacterized protein LOC119109921 n=1 Tax=Pollicipes pollicipes TaxID=41117 RepID=UPI001884C3EE|nr:uncharacterized protein LOC119109921 [Pollicipes pollicipes]
MTAWKMNVTDGKMPTAVYTVKMKEDTKSELVAAAVGAVSLDADGALSFTAAGVMPDGVFAVHVTLEPAGGGHHKLDWCPMGGWITPLLCVAVGGQQRCLLVGDADGHLTVVNKCAKRHALYQCGADPDPAVMQVRALGTSTLVACDRNGMVCRLEQSERLNVLRAEWEPVLPAARRLQPPAASSCQLPTDAQRREVRPPGADAEPVNKDGAPPEPTAPTALLVTDTELVLGDAAGRLWCRSGAEYSCTKAHAAAVTWVGRDPCRPEILYSSGVGEFEFASCVRHCALVAAPAAGLPTGLVHEHGSRALGCRGSLTALVEL